MTIRGWLEARWLDRRYRRWPTTKRHAVDVGSMFLEYKDVDLGLHELPWAGVLGPHCHAVLERRVGFSFHGRCELKRPDGDHALERGMAVVRWSTEPRLQ